MGLALWFLQRNSSIQINISSILGTARKNIMLAHFKIEIEKLNLQFPPMKQHIFDKIQVSGQIRENMEQICNI